MVLIWYSVHISIYARYGDSYLVQRIPLLRYDQSRWMKWEIMALGHIKFETS